MKKTKNYRVILLLLTTLSCSCNAMNSKSKGFQRLGQKVVAQVQKDRETKLENLEKITKKNKEKEIEKITQMLEDIRRSKIGQISQNPPEENLEKSNHTEQDPWEKQKRISRKLKRLIEKNKNPIFSIGSLRGS